MKKIILSIALVLVMFMGLLYNPIEAKAANTTLSSGQIAEYFKSRVGATVPQASCLAFIADGFKALGAERSSACCAYTYGSSHIVSTSMDNIPIGADVFLNWNSNYTGTWYVCPNCGKYCHHIGVYVGDGNIVHTSGGKVVMTSLDTMLKYWNVSFRGWGYHGNVNIDGSGSSTPTSIFTNTTAENITASNATIKADMDSVRYLTTAGVYFGTEASNMQKITETVNGNAKTIFYDANKWIGTLQSNTTYWYQLYVVTGGTEYKTDLKSFTTTSAWQDAYVEGVTETNAVIKGTTNENKYVTTAGIYIGTDASNMHKVVENVNVDAKWYVYDLNKWYGVLRPGTTYVYQLYTVYDGVEHRSNLNSFTTADNTAPTISDVTVTDVSASGYTVSCVVSDNGNVARVSFPTWTELNGQDDINSDWYNNTAVYAPDTNGRYAFRVNTSGHNNEAGKYITHIYAYDNVGNHVSTEVVCEIYPLQSIAVSTTSQSLTVGAQFNLTISYNPTNTTDDKSVTWNTSNANVATIDNGTVKAVGAGTATITAAVGGKSASCTVTVEEKTSQPGNNDANNSGTGENSGTTGDSGMTGGSGATDDSGVTGGTGNTDGSTGGSGATSIPVTNGWYTVNGKSYWYENGVRQGTEGRGKEIYDTDSDAWYWLDAVQDGAKATGKDVYQESSGGKWVRYDANGLMIKGWSEKEGNRYYFDPVTGAMAKGNVVMSGTVYSFDVDTGVLLSSTQVEGGILNGWVTADGKDYWYENGVRQGYDPDNEAYRGKEIYDPGTNAWYWLDNVQQGAKAVSKDVYQESYSAYPDRPDGTGKWVRYDENGHMVKGWQTTEAGTYYFEPVTGAMAKGTVSIGGASYNFDVNTGILQQ